MIYITTCRIYYFILSITLNIVHSLGTRRSRTPLLTLFLFIGAEFVFAKPGGVIELYTSDAETGAIKLLSSNKTFSTIRSIDNYRVQGSKRDQVSLFKNNCCKHGPSIKQLTPPFTTYPPLLLRLSWVQTLVQSPSSVSRASPVTLLWSRSSVRSLVRPGSAASSLVSTLLQSPRAAPSW